MKLSRWNSFISLGNSSNLIYNSFSDSFVCLKGEDENFNAVCNNEITHLPDDFIEKLIEAGILVQDDKDEVAELSELIHNIDNDDSFLHIIVNPTLDCNFSCWYCYENHIKDSSMTPRMVDALIVYIRNKIESNQNIRNVYLSFFGGEPLLRFYEVVKPLIIAINQICNVLNKDLSVNFTSNSFLIDESIIQFLKPYKASFQITLDGGRVSHDNTRFGKGKTPSFDIIVNNIIKLAKAGMHVTARINYTAKNIDSTKEIIDLLSSIPKENRSNISVDYQRVWQDITRQDTDNTYEKVRIFRKILRKCGYKTANNKIANMVKWSCYADKRNELLINYNGDVFACTARDFKTENRLGVLSTDGNITIDPDKFEERMNSRFIKQVCHNCRIAPLCGGGCRTKCLENMHHDRCNLGYSNDKIDDLILERFEERFLND